VAPRSGPFSNRREWFKVVLRKEHRRTARFRLSGCSVRFDRFGSSSVVRFESLDLN
jgi:hypothetical protein